MTGWLADKSALTRLRHSPDASEWIGRIDRGLVRVVTPTRMEINEDYELIAEITGQPTERLRMV